MGIKHMGNQKQKIKREHKKRKPWISIFFIILFVLNGIFGEFIMPNDPVAMDLTNKMLPPVFLGGIWKYPLGTDQLGRDVLSRLIQGGRVSLIVAAAAILIGGIVGTTLGILAGYYGKACKVIIMRLTDASLAFPSILLALLLSLSIGPGVKSAIIAIAFSMWAKYTRTIQTEVQVLKEKNYIVQAKIMGASDLRIILRHIVPNILDTVIVMVSLEIGMAILSEATLSFLGLSVIPPTASWGQMIADGNTYFQRCWWVSVFPAVATVLTVFSFQRFSEYLKAGKGGIA
jgi:peptide/nickel transport system permease protein